MKILIAISLTIAAFAAFHIPAARKKKGMILALYAIGMILFFVIYNIRTLDLILPFYHPVNQSMYQLEFLEVPEYPDAFLDTFFKGKTVYTKDDAYVVSDREDPDADDDSGDAWDDDGNYWLYHYYHAVNMWNYLDLNKAVVIKDSSLNNVILSDEQKSYFEDMGPANDMLRFTFALTPYTGEWGNAFYYYWFYNSFIGNSRVYICTDELMEADEITVIWQQEDEHDTDSYYIASRKYYDEVIAR